MIPFLILQGNFCKSFVKELSKIAGVKPNGGKIENYIYNEKGALSQTLERRTLDTKNLSQILVVYYVMLCLMFVRSRVCHVMGLRGLSLLVFVYLVSSVYLESVMVGHNFINYHARVN